MRGNLTHKSRKHLGAKGERKEVNTSCQLIFPGKVRHDNQKRTEVRKV
jgi:hypothetical protein